MNQAGPHSEVPAQTVPRHVAGLGASAGGLDPLIEFLRSFPLGRGFAFIVVQHLAKSYGSALASLLQSQTSMQVLEARDGLRIEPEQVYVITPATRLSVAAGRLVVRGAVADAAPAQQIDELFTSLAASYGARAVGVVFSGMGTDGSKGLRAIVEQGGTGAAQEPQSAQFDSMPRSAASPGIGVLVDTPMQLPRRILAALSADAPALRGSTGLAGPTHSDAQALVMATTQVASVTGHDFSQYKSSTVRRRIERRMAIHGAASLADYAELLAGNTQEAELLFKELLIGVTAFFRDPPLWDAVRDAVLPALLARVAARPQRRLRVWVVGCSTGEEAYTIAMLLRELLDDSAAWRGVTAQIFATDLSADAIQTARRGVYPAASLAAVSAGRTARFFVPENAGYRVAKPVREMVLFALHDLVTDPPFARLDIVSCRNLLIYFKSTLQQRVLPLFHYVLQPGGWLLLGNSETTGRFESMFHTVDAKLRIHTRIETERGAATLIFPVRPVAPTPSTPGDSRMSIGPSSHTASLQLLADRLMLEEFSPPAVLVSEEGDVLYVSGRTGKFLEPAAGKANWNVHAMAREGLRPALSSGLRQVRADGRPVEACGLTVEPGGTGIGVDISIRPVTLAGQGGLMLVVFRETPPVAAAPPAGPAQRRRRSEHGAELKRALEEAQALREEMRSSQEELMSANEELQSTNEELQSANEELTTSKEEMQAMNEELQTVNAELMSRLDDLALAQSDLKNLLNSTQIATLFIDGAMNVRRFTEPAKKVINLREGDIGRPLSDLTTALEYPALADDIGDVLRTLVYSEKEIRTSDARWFSVRIMPYRTQDNVVDGAVITFADITASKDLEARLRIGN